MQLSSQDIFTMLNYLGIKYKTQSNRNGWIDIICPLHNDKDFGNAGLNLNSGAIHCYRCGQKSHILKEIKKFSNISDFKQLLDFLKLNFYIHPSFNSYVPLKKESKEKRVTKNFDVINKEYTKYVVQDIDMQSCKYMYDRKFTSQFCEEFNIKHIISGFYKDYFAIPVIDTKKNIVTIEYRKLLQYEYYKKFFKKDVITEIDVSNFKKYCKDENIYVTEFFELMKGDSKYYNSTIEYLLNKKVRYELGSRIDETIWNVDNLDFNEDVYVCEGIGSVPKLYNQVSQNITCTFGSNVSEYQIEYLKKFNKRVILIPDNDEAGKKMIMTLFPELKNFYLILSSFEDTDEEYIDDIIHTIPTLANDYVAQELTKELF